MLRSQKTDGVQAVGLKSAIKKKEFRVRYNPITCQLRVFRNEKPVKDVELDLWAKFTAEGRQRMKASAYREWCEGTTVTVHSLLSLTLRTGQF